MRIKKRFKFKSLANKNVKKAVIPATVRENSITYKVTTIGKKAFQNCKKLNTVVVGKNVVKIETSAFYCCKKLRSITIKSKNLKSVSKKAFVKMSRTLKIYASKQVRKKIKI